MSSNNDDDSAVETRVAADSGKKLSELKVIELRSELEKRSLDKTGVKAVLMERLEKALESEGKVSADYLFTEDELKTKKSTGRLSKGAVEKEAKDDEEDEDEEDEDASQSIATDNKSVEPNDSANLSGNSEVENSEKSTDAAPIIDDVKTEVQDIISTEEPISSEEMPKTPGNDTHGKDTSSPVKTAPVSTDPPALPPPQSSSTPLKDVNTKEEDEPKDADKPAVASTQEDQSDEVKQDDDAPAPTATTDDKKNDDEDKKEEKNPVGDLLPPSPTSVPCVAPLTLKDTINMDTSSAQQNEENESLIVHVDDTQNDLDADLLTSRANGLKLRQAAKEKAIGKTEGNKSDVGSDPPEAGSETGGGGGSVGVSSDKGSTDDSKKTEKKPDEKKDEKIDGKLKSSPVSKLKVVKGDNQNSRNLWISGLSSTTQAADVKEAFSKYGKVVVVKIVTNLRTPGAENRAFLTMSSLEEAAKCIQHLNQTELHGKKMSISTAKNNLTSQTKSGEKKTVVKQGAGQNSRNLWVSGLSSNTRATDLKSLFSKYGKVVDAKVVTNVRSPGARCYGFLTMYSSEEASKCIQHLNQTELHGKMISVEKAKNDPGLQSVKKTETKPEVKKDKKEGEKKDGDKKEGVKKEGEKKDEKDRRPVSRRDDRRHSSSASRRRPFDKSRVDRSKEAVKRRSKEDVGTDKSKMSADKEKDTTPKAKSKESPTAAEGNKDKKKESKKDVLSFDQIRAERERERVRQSQRRLREDQRLEEIGRAREMQRDFQRRQKDEAMRLAKSLSMERAKLERVKLESERIKLEREYLVQERIRTEQRREEILRFEEQKRRALKRSYERNNVQNEDGYWNEPKRAAVNPPSSNRFEHGFTNENRFEEQKRRALKRSYERNNVQNEDGYWNEPKRAAVNPPSSNRFEHGFTNENRFNEFEPRDYERRVERYDRREARSIDNTAATRFEERKDRDLTRRDIGPAREMRDRDDRFDRRDVGPSRDRSNDRNHDRKELGPDRGRDSDRRNISAHDRLGRVRNSPAVSQPPPPPPPPTSDHRTHWGSGYVSGSGGRSGSGGMVQNMGHNLTYVNPNAQSSSMVGGGNNMGSRMQEPRFDAYMQRY